VMNKNKVRLGSHEHPREPAFAAFRVRVKRGAVLTPCQPIITRKLIPSKGRNPKEY
jgi:hypothetical protein